MPLLEKIEALVVSTISTVIITPSRHLILTVETKCWEKASAQTSAQKTKQTLTKVTLYKSM